MKRELIIINVILALTVIGAAVELRRGWVDFETTHSPAGIQFDGEALGVPAGAESPARPVQDWTAIAEQNLFSFDRNDLVIESKPRKVRLPRVPARSCSARCRSGTSPWQCWPAAERGIGRPGRCGSEE